MTTQATNDVHANTNAYSALIEAFADDVKISAQATKAREARTGNYNSIVAAGAMCSSREEWDATDALIQHNITHNVDKVAVKLKAELRETPSKDGATYTVPRPITNALSVIRFAWANGHALTAVNPKTGKMEPVSFGSLRKLRTAKLDAQKAEDAKKLTGTDKLRHELYEMAAKLAKAAATISDPTLVRAHKAMVALMGDLVAKANDKAQGKSNVGEEIAEAA